VAALHKSGNIMDGESSSEDVFLGNVELEPRWDEQMQDEWFALQGGTGKVRVQVAFKRDHVSAQLLAVVYKLSLFRIPCQY